MTCVFENNLSDFQRFVSKLINFRGSSLEGVRCGATARQRLIWESGWFSGHQSCFPPLLSRFNSWVVSGLTFSRYLNLTSRVFLRVLQFLSVLKIESQSITSGWVCSDARSHMVRMAAAVGAFTCICSDPVEPVDPEKLL